MQFPKLCDVFWEAVFLETVNNNQKPKAVQIMLRHMTELNDIDADPVYCVQIMLRHMIELNDIDADAGLFVCLFSRVCIVFYLYCVQIMLRHMTELNDIDADAGLFVRLFSRVCI
eukprot:Pgem_evm1s7968